MKFTKKTILFKTITLISISTMLRSAELSSDQSVKMTTDLEDHSTSPITHLIPASTSMVSRSPSPCALPQSTINYDTANLETIKARIAIQTPQQTAEIINRLSVERAAQILSYEAILKQSGKIFEALGETKALAIWTKIQTQDQQGVPTQWNYELLITKAHWKNATVEHFRHWIKVNPRTIETHVTADNISNFIIALIGKRDVTRLSLTHKNLSSIPTEMKQLTQLQILDLRFNKLTSLPQNVFNGLTSLKDLCLTSNKLTSLPDNVFNDLTSLKELHLEYNELTSLPDNVFNDLTSLEELHLGFNKLTSLPQNVFNGLTSLEELHLGFNKLTSLPQNVFNGLTSLEELHLDYNKLTSLPQNVFNGLTNLKDLYLSSNKLTSLPQNVFNGLTNLKDLYLYSNKLTSLPQNVFNGLTSLGELRLTSNKLTSLPQNVFNGLTSLKELHLTSNKLTSLPQNVFNRLTNLVTLSLKNNELTSLPDNVFQSLTSLEKLYLNSNELTSLQDNVFNGLTSLEYLDLSNNKLTSLPQNMFNRLTKLERLHLQDNKLTSLQDNVFQSLTSLVTLHLQDNKLTSLQDNVFQSLTSLVTLHLQDNKLTSLQDNVFNGLTNLVTLYLQDNKLTSLQDNVFNGLTNLVTLYLYSNKLTSLQDNVFNGLTKLENLSLEYNKLTSLQDNVFNGLTNLKDLYLYGNKLTSLPDNVFNDLTSLKELHLNNNELTSLPQNVFQGLTSLVTLHLRHNKLTTFSASIFRLERLRVIFLYKCFDSALTIADEAFAQLADVIRGAFNNTEVSIKIKRLLANQLAGCGKQCVSNLGQELLRSLPSQHVDLAKYFTTINVEKLKDHNPQGLSPLTTTASDPLVYNATVIIDYFKECLYGSEGLEGYESRSAARGKAAITQPQGFLERHLDKVGHLNILPSAHSTPSHKPDFTLLQINDVIHKLIVILNQDDSAPVIIPTSHAWTFASHTKTQKNQKRGLRAILHHVYRVLKNGSILQEEIDAAWAILITQASKCTTGQMNGIEQFGKKLGLNLSQMYFKPSAEGHESDRFWQVLCEFKSKMAALAITSYLDDTHGAGIDTHQYGRFQSTLDQTIGLPLLMVHYDETMTGTIADETRRLWQMFATYFSLQTISRYMLKYFNPPLPKPELEGTGDSEYLAEKQRLEKLGTERRVGLRSIPELAKMFYDNDIFKEYAFDETSVADIYTGKQKLTLKEIMLYIKFFISYQKKFTNEEKLVHESGLNQIKLFSLMTTLPMISRDSLLKVQKFCNNNSIIPTSDRHWEQVLKFVINNPPFPLLDPQKEILLKMLTQQGSSKGRRVGGIASPMETKERDSMPKLISDIYLSLIRMCTMDDQPAKIGALSYLTTSREFTTTHGSKTLVPIDAIKGNFVIKYLRAKDLLIKSDKFTIIDSFDTFAQGAGINMKRLKRLKCYRMIKVIVTMFRFNENNIEASNLLHLVNSQIIELRKVSGEIQEGHIMQSLLERVKSLVSNYKSITEFNQSMFELATIFYILDHKTTIIAEARRLKSAPAPAAAPAAAAAAAAPAPAAAAPAAAAAAAAPAAIILRLKA